MFSWAIIMIFRWSVALIECFDLLIGPFATATAIHKMVIVVRWHGPVPARDDDLARAARLLGVVSLEVRAPRVGMRASVVLPIRRQMPVALAVAAHLLFQEPTHMSSS